VRTRSAAWYPFAMRTAFAPVALPVALLAALAIASPARAQLARPTAGPELPPISLAAPDDALAVDANPAALALLPSWSAVGVAALAPTASATASGGAAYYAMPLFFGLSFGVSAGTRAQGDGLDGARLVGTGSFALALRLSSSFAIGMVTRGFTGPRTPLDGTMTVDASISFRPSPLLAFSLLARDLGGPTLQGVALRDVPRSFALAVALRPVREWPATLDVTAAVDTDGHVAARGALSVPISHLGSVYASAEVDHADADATREVRGMAGLVVQWDHLATGGGVIASDHRPGDPGAFMTVRAEGAARDGLPEPRYVLDLELAGTTERGIVATSVALERAVHDDRVVGVLLRPRGSGLGLAYAQELRMLIDALRAAHKPVVCHFESATGSELYACAAATRTFVDPAGGVRLMGPSTDSILIGDALRELGVRADFVRIGRYKSAVEQLVNARSSDDAHEERRVLLDDFAARLRGDLARSWHGDDARAQARIDAGPYTAEEAVRAHVVDGALDEQDLDDALEETMGGRYPRYAQRPEQAPREWTTASRVGVVVVDGDIVDGDNVDVPLLEVHLTGGHTAVAAIDALAADPTVGAIVVRVDSPGGSALAADQIWRALRRAGRHKPVVASMGATAASGGYYVASAAREIWADPSTLTGSIGIFYGKVDVQPLAHRLGVTIESDGRGLHAGAESYYRPFTAEERGLLADKVRIWYRQFLGRVHEGRGMAPTRIDALGRGRVWSGDRARALGLVDHLGGLASAIAEARRLGGLREDCDVLVRPERPSSLLDYVVRGVGRGSASAAADEEIRGALGEGAQAGDAGLGALLDALPPATRRALGTAVAMRHVAEGSAFAWMPYLMEVR